MKAQKSLKAGVLFGILFSVNSNASEPLTEQEKITLKELEKVNHKQDDLVIEKLANGTEMINLKGRFQMLSKAKKNANTIHYQCGNHEHHDKNLKAEIE